ncbi:hypothetical protein ACQJBY_015893 [Aegilops geniculata]
MLYHGRRQGRSLRLLESPTSTGRSLSLLPRARLAEPLPAPRAPRRADPLLHGGAFVPDDTQQQPTPGISAKAADAKNKNAPTIYYVM